MAPHFWWTTKDGIFSHQMQPDHQHTKQVIFLEDNQMVSLSTGLSPLLSPRRKRNHPTIHTLDWDFEEAQKGDIRTFFLKEIHEQPKLSKTSPSPINHHKTTSQSY